MCIIHQTGNSRGHSSFIIPPSSLTLTIPRLQHQTCRPILPIQTDFLLFQHAECLPRDIFAMDLFGFENVAKFVVGETENQLTLHTRYSELFPSLSVFTFDELLTI